MNLVATLDALTDTGVETLLDGNRVAGLLCCALSCSHLEGEFWECGVFKGGSAAILSRVIQNSHPRILRLFDTFEGLPDVDPEVDFHPKGIFCCGFKEARAKLRDAFVRFHPGVVPGTFMGLEGCKVALAHLDMDLFWSTKDAIEFIWPRIVPGGIIVFDDYREPTCPGVEKAVDEFFGSQIEVIGPFQAIVKKDETGGMTP